MQSKISCSGKESHYTAAFKTEFNKEWENSVDLLKFPISKYIQNTQASFAFSIHPDIRKLFKVNSEKKSRVLDRIKAIILVHTTLSNKTVKAVYQNQSSWDKAGWDFYCSERKREFEYEGTEGNALLLIEKGGNKFLFKKITVRDNCLLSTDDGKYFIAYEQLGKAKRENKNFRHELESLGVYYHKRNFSYKYRLSVNVIDLIQRSVGR